MMEEVSDVTVETTPNFPDRAEVVVKVVYPDKKSQEEYFKWQQEHLQNPEDYPIVEKFDFSKGSQVEYLGVMHSLDPSNPQHQKISEEVENFIERKDKEEVIVFYEGGVGELPANAFEGLSRETVIQQYGEAGLLCFEAKKRGLKVVGMEPPTREMYERVRAMNLEGITEDTFAVTEMFKNAVVLMRNKEAQKGIDGKNFTSDEVFNLLKTVSQTTGWRDNELSVILSKLEDGELSYEQIYQTKLQINNEFLAVINNEFQKQSGTNMFNGTKFLLTYEDMYKYFAPGEEKSGLNVVSNATSQVRDQYVVGQIYDTISSGKNVFIAAGDSHLYKALPALQFLSQHS